MAANRFLIKFIFDTKEKIHQLVTPEKSESKYFQFKSFFVSELELAGEVNHRIINGCLCI